VTLESRKQHPRFSLFAEIGRPRFWLDNAEKGCKCQGSGS